MAFFHWGGTVPRDKEACITSRTFQVWKVLDNVGHWHTEFKCKGFDESVG